MDIENQCFVWGSEKESLNVRKHGVDFVSAAMAFLDQNRRVYVDDRHSEKEERYFCVGKVDGRILTVRFMVRDGKIRIIGAGHWRKGAGQYAQEET